MKETKIVELVIADDSQELAIDAISLVSSPAIEQDFVFFGKEKNNLTFAKVDEEKRMLVSPALIPNKRYLDMILTPIQITMFILVLKQYVRLLNYI